MRNLVVSTFLRQAPLGGLRAMHEKALLSSKRRGHLNDCYQAVKLGHLYMADSRGADQLTFSRYQRVGCTSSEKGLKAKYMAKFLNANSRSARFPQILLGQ